MREYLRLWLLLAAACCSSCSVCGTTALLPIEQEVRSKSQQGLALAKVLETDQPSIEVRSFDGRKEIRQMDCCSHIVRESLSRNRIVTVDYGALPTVATAADFMSGSQIVVIDVQGQVVARSELPIVSSLFSLAPDEKQFAFMGVPGYRGAEGNGVYVAPLQGLQARKLFDVDPTPKVHLDAKTQSSLDWSPDSTRVLFSDGLSIVICDLRTGRSRKVADGADAQWAPNGDRVTYLTPTGRVMMLNVDTGQSKPVLAGHEILHTPVWSPDGEFLLVVERHTAFFPNFTYGRYGVYRISDAAFLPIPDYGVAGPPAYWIQLRKK